MDEAAREWGLRPDEPEGRSVSALMGAIGWFARLHEAAVKRLEAVAAERATVAKMQLDAAVELRRHADAALHQARTAMIQEEVIRENLVARMIDQTLPMFAERLQKCLVIKEWVYNTRVRQRRLAATWLGALTSPGPARTRRLAPIVTGMSSSRLGTLSA